jgi:peptide/nickel transport system permease protein
MVVVETAETTAAPRAASALPTRLAMRLARALLVTFWVMVISFGLIRLAPGDPILARLGLEAEPEAIERLRRQLRLDVDPVTQFIEFFFGLLRGDMGRSIENGRSVAGLIAESLPVTLWVIGTTVVMSLVIAVPLALAVALSRRAWVAYLFRASTAVFLAIPAFFTALVGLLVFGLHLQMAPIIGYEPSFPANLHYLWLPALVISITLVPVLARVLCSSIVETMNEEFVETGVIRGVDRFRFYWVYILKPSLAPTIVLLSYMIGVMIGSTVIIETIFTLPGIGRNLVQAVVSRDYPVVQGIVLVFGLMVVLIGLVGDLLARWIDPRVDLA